MKIVHVAMEFAPIAKAGGLGEVLVGLARECTLLGKKVEVILPKYDFIDLKTLSHVNMEVPDFKCYEKGSLHPNAVFSAEYEGISLKLLDMRHYSGYFHRGKIYGGEDEATRFLYFSRAAVEYLKLRGEPVDILHLHDWHVSAIPLIIRDLLPIKVGATILTIHNAEYQGRCAVWDLDAIGLVGTKYLTPELLQDDDKKCPEAINLLKGGIVFSDWVTTVSPGYAKELLSVEFATPIQTTLKKYRAKFSGILNGLDLALWNPGYGKQDPIETIVSAKKRAKEAVREKYKLCKNREPWIGSITRLTYQKGPELIEEAIHETIKQKGIFCLLGAPSSSKELEQFQRLQKKYAASGQLLIELDYDEALAHKLYTSLDFLILPSRYEPCGLAQMIAMHHGTLPIARATGGHKDTIIDGQTGFLFTPYTEMAMREAVQRAISLLCTKPLEIQEMIKQAIAIDWSWKKPAQEYLALYNKLLAK